MEIPQKIKNRTTSNSTSGYLSKKNKNTNLKGHMHPTFTEALLTVAETQTRENVQGQIKA